MIHKSNTHWRKVQNCSGFILKTTVRIPSTSRADLMSTTQVLPEPNFRREFILRMFLRMVEDMTVTDVDCMSVGYICDTSSSILCKSVGPLKSSLTIRPVDGIEATMSMEGLA